jgi:hypothetical protein
MNIPGIYLVDLNILCIYQLYTGYIKAVYISYTFYSCIYQFLTRYGRFAQDFVAMDASQPP